MVTSVSFLKSHGSAVLPRTAPKQIDLSSHPVYCSGYCKMLFYFDLKLADDIPQFRRCFIIPQSITNTPSQRAKIVPHMEILRSSHWLEGKAALLILVSQHPLAE